MAGDAFPAPSEGFVLTHFIVAQDVARSRDFYVGVLGGTVVLDGQPTIVKLANGWVIINVGGGPTDDKPEVVLEPPSDPNRASAFLNIRVADIQAAYRDWSAKGAVFLTPPKDHGREIRCYMRDPDGHLIEVGQGGPGAVTRLSRPGSGPGRGRRGSAPARTGTRCRSRSRAGGRAPGRSR
jgi:catechol 2,3-dioxygenase-like lactoylglutathione lyase family enzyme